MPVESQIRILPDHVANKIAAGEVIERPASVLKELLENSLDAGATEIDVEVRAGGRLLVSVADNGCGLARDDALLAVERHATSKIRDVDDIERIATFGFRGEALAAIASVSRFVLRTRRAADLAGSELLIAGGRMQDVREVGCPPGTTVEVRNLFFNVPARRKFLRADATELAHLRQAFSALAWAHPGAGLSLAVDGRVLHKLPAGGRLEDRLRDLLAPECSRCLLRLDFAAGGIAVSGFAGQPSLSRADRSEQHFFINGRPAGAALLGAAVREGYHTLLPRERFPVVFLFITLDPGRVDVNVHPAKKEVRFREPGAVRDTVLGALRQALGAAPRAVAASGAAAAGPGAVTLTELAHLVPAAAFPYPRAGAAGPASPEPAAPLAAAPAATPAGAPWSQCRILGRVGGLYVVIETEDGLVLMDPHAAHERVLFDAFLAQALAGSVPSQRLLFPATVTLPPAAAERLRGHLAILQPLGFGVSDFGGDAFLVDVLPSCLGAVSPANLLPDLAAALEQAGTRTAARRLLEENIARAACRAAVKAHQDLTDNEIRDLAASLAAAEMPYTCPHGRPTLVHISFQELARKFGRA